MLTDEEMNIAIKKAILLKDILIDDFDGKKMSFCNASAAVSIAALIVGHTFASMKVCSEEDKKEYIKLIFNMVEDMFNRLKNDKKMQD